MYNCEKYIADCLDSILNSDLPKSEYEVIIINDGSKDKSPEIVKPFIFKNNHFTYLTQDNQGQSVARNYGLEKAKGEYVWFVDGDDKLDNSIIGMYSLLKSLSNIDILAFLLRQETENGAFISFECEQPRVTHNIVIKGREAIIMGYMPSSVCALVIRRNLLLDNNLSFKRGITQQDVELSYRLFSHANDVYFSRHNPYIYIYHEGSTSKSIDINKRIKYESDKVEIIKSFQQLAHSFEKTDRELSQKIRQYADGALFGCVYNLLIKRKKWRPLGVSKAVLEKLKEADLYPMKASYGSWKKKLVTSILNREFLLT